MDGAKILDGLRAMLSNVSTEADDFDEHARLDRGVLREAIALLTPEPVTEEGLRAEGFKEGQVLLIHNPDNDVTTAILFDHDCGEFWMDINSGGTMLPGIEFMQELRTVIKALRGKYHESEARR